MDFRKEVFSKILSKEDYNVCFKEIIQILRNNKYKEVDILFGVAWGNDYKNWTPFSIPVGSIAHEIALAEQLNVGTFGKDDFYIIINPIQTEILFCHEMDIHLRFNQENIIIDDMLKSWQARDLIRSTKINSD